MSALPSAVKVTALQKAEAAWGADLPLEVRALAERCDAGTAEATSRVIGISAGAVSNVLRRKVANYDLPKIFGKIRGALLGETVECPRKGSMSRQVCLRWQAKPFAQTSSDRVAMFHACRSGCQHSRLPQTQLKGA